MTATTARTLLCDTSVVVPLVVEDHEHHEATVDEIGARRLGLSGHAAFEAFSVLTRLPPPARRSPAVVQRVLEQGFPETRFLPEEASRSLLGRLAAVGVAGGVVYDALVGATAAHHGLPLATRDKRAVEVYRALGVDLVVIS